MIDPTKISHEKLAEMNDALILDNNYLRAELRKWKDVFGHLGTADQCGNEWIALQDKVAALEEEIRQLTQIV